DIDCAAPLRFVEQIVVEIAAAKTVETGLAPTLLLSDDLHAQAHQWPDVGSDEAVGADDVDHAPACGETDADLAHARVSGSRRGVDLLAERHLVREWDQVQRIVGAVHRLIGPRWWQSRKALGGIK